MHLDFDYSTGLNYVYDYLEDLGSENIYSGLCVIDLYLWLLITLSLLCSVSTIFTLLIEICHEIVSI